MKETKLVDPRKRAFLSFDIKIKNLKKIVLIFFYCFGFKNNRSTNFFQVRIVKTHKKPLITAQNGQNCVFDGKKLFWLVFLQKPKNSLFGGGSKQQFLKLKCKKKIIHLFFNVKGSFMPIFTKNMNIWAHQNILKMKTLTRVPRRAQKCWIWTF